MCFLWGSDWIFIYYLQEYEKHNRSLKVTVQGPDFWPTPYTYIQEYESLKGQLSEIHILYCITLHCAKFILSALQNCQGTSHFEPELCSPNAEPSQIREKNIWPYFNAAQSPIWNINITNSCQKYLLNHPLLLTLDLYLFVGSLLNDDVSNLTYILLNHTTTGE
jgi:hypothetical protein